MSPITKAREAARQAGEQYGFQVIDAGSPLPASDPVSDTDQAYITLVSRHIGEQANKLSNKGMAPELVQLWKGAATKAATERLKEVSLIPKRFKQSGL